MFKKLSLKEQLKKEQSKNKALMTKNQTLEEAVLELAQLVSEVKNGETIPE